MTIYLDTDYLCHTTDDGTRRPIETDAFEGKCNYYIEGYRYIPDGETWTRPDGTIFHGQMISPVEDYATLEKAQAQHELDEARRWGSLGIPQEQDFTATRNYPSESFIGVRGELYEVIRSIPQYTSIITGQNVIKTTVEHYLDTLKEEQ